jgi:hypothetical protein
MPKKTDIEKVVMVLAKAAGAYILYDSFTRTFERRRQERLKKLIKQKAQK